MVSVFLLILIYLAFISLGLPDGLLGVSWPEMRSEWVLSLETAGYVSIMVVTFTAWSGILSGVIIRRLGTGKVVMLSGLLTGLSIIGISYVPNFYWLIALSCGLGFGAGSVDTALNHYVALHFRAHHMNWLHCCWGVGASMGPLFISHALATGGSWRSGYLQIGVIQLGLALLFLLSLSLWSLHEATVNKELEPVAIAAQDVEDGQPVTGLFRFLKTKGVWRGILAFAAYSGAEGGAGLWGSSYLVLARGCSVELAALYVSIYFVGITSGRFISGFLSLKFNNRSMIRFGVCFALIGTISMMLPLPSVGLGVAFFVYGLGLAPIFPSMIHQTPVRFGKSRSQDIIGYQIAGAYVGFAIFPPLMGILLKHISIHCFAGFILICVLIVASINPYASKLREKVS